MRIIGGSWRGRQIGVLPGPAVRPTGDRVREAWFSIIQFDVPKATVIDLCAGSGALGIEALSRGASHVTFVDSSSTVLALILKNLTALGANPESYTVHKDDAQRYVASLPAHAFSLGFADPPYAAPLAAALSAAWLAVPFASVFSIEHPSAVDLGDGGDRRRYGLTAISFYRA